MEGTETGGAAAPATTTASSAPTSNSPATSAPAAATSAPASSASTPAPAATKSPSRDPKPLFAGTAPAPTGDAPADTKLIFGKYKDIGEAEKGYRDLYAKLTEKGAVPPDSYDIDTAFKDGGITPLDRETAKDAYEAFTSQLKEHGFNQKQLAWMTKFGGEWMRAQMAKFGPQIDTDGERGKLAGAWGNHTEARGKEVTAWATETLPPDVVNRPMVATAEGLRFLHQMMMQQRGPVPMQNSPAPTADVTDLNSQVEALMKSPEYRNASDPMYKPTHAKADKLLAQIKKAMGT